MSDVTLKFHGAAGTVTGSCFEITGAGKTILVDCGLFQGTRSLEALNHEKLPFDPKKIDAVLLTHAHLDHSGRLAYLYARGCKAKTYCTAPSADIIKPLLQDAAKLQAADVERRNRRADRAGLPPFTPLYDGKDIAKLHKNVRKVAFCEEGDIGPGRAINCTASALGGYDHIICESTYGDRDRDLVLVSERRETLARHVEDVMAAGGNLLIPAFALERTQAILEDFDALFASKRLPPINVFLDSPLAQKVTMAVMRYRDSGTDMLKRTNIRFTQNTAESKKLNRMSGIVIIAGSGMCEGGRIRHHLIHNLPNRQSRLLLSGYQVAGTLGSVLRDGAKRVRISGLDVLVKAQVDTLEGYSNHADRSGLAEWIKDRTPVRGSIFLVHGERTALSSLAETLATIPDLPPAIVPALEETWTLHPGKRATLSAAGRPDASDLMASRDWVSRLTMLRQEMEEKLSEQTSNRDREKMLAALKRALESVN